MFIGAEIRLAVGFGHAQAKLADLIRGGLLGRASGGVYDEWRTALARDGPWGTAPWGTALGMSRLARVQFRDTAAHGDLAIWPLRWEVAGPQAPLVTVLDADIKLTPAGADASLDQAIVRRCATAMIQAFTHHIAAAVTHPVASPGARHAGILPEAWLELET